MNISEASARGLDSQKVVADFSQLLKTVEENTELRIAVGQDVKFGDNVELGVSGEVGTKAGKISISAIPGLGAEASLDESGINYNVSSGGNNVYGDPSIDEGKTTISVPINKVVSVKTLTENEPVSNRYKEIKNSYNPNQKFDDDKNR